MHPNKEQKNFSFLMGAAIFIGAAAAILIPLYLAFPPVPV